jgi:ABC-2 type transport system permease protein
MTDAAVHIAPTRTFYWSVRRELWEHRSIYLGPVIAAGVVLTGFLLASIHGSHVQMDLKTDGSGAVLALIPYAITAGVILATSLLVSFAFCLGALNAERRDRSILFWKSLPVSDTTTVLSKAAVPIVIVPLVALGVMIAAELLVALLGAVKGFHPASSPAIDPLGIVVNLIVYGPIVLGLWYAPIYGWLLLVSSWAKRGSFLWAVLPPLALCVLEAIVLHSHRLSDLLSLRINGGLGAAFAMSAPTLAAQSNLPHTTREQFFTSPDLWLGLLAAAAFLAIAVWRRRRAEPV